MNRTQTSPAVATGLATRLLASRLLLLCFLVPLTLGCVSSPVPTPLTTAEFDQVAHAQFPARVAVEPFERPVYSDRLVRSLDDTGLFLEVGRLGEVAEPDLIARVERPISGAALLPLVPALTLGIVPAVVKDEERGEVFSLRPTTAEGRIAIDFTYTGQTTMGWYALLLAPSAKHSLKRSERTRAFQNALAWRIVQEAEAINAALGVE